MKVLFFVICIGLLAGCSSDSSSENEVIQENTDNSDSGSGSGSGSDSPGNMSPQPNILLIIADDQGKDASPQYALSTDLPLTPNLDDIANQGVVYENAWATPMCAPTRAAMLTGRYGFNTGVVSVPGDLSDEFTTIQSLLKQTPATSNYATGFFGKWHLGSARDLEHPNRMGIDHFAGVITGNIDDYYNWNLTIDGESTTSTDYQTSKLVDLSIDWLASLGNDEPWFMWMAFAAPHSPLHLPPDQLHSRQLSGTEEDIAAQPREYFLASIEAMDTEIGRLLGTLSEETLENTLIIYIGDNGSSKSVIDTSVYRKPQAKGTLYEGSVNVPMFISGAMVTRNGERDSSLINSTDLLATIADAVGIEQNIEDDDSTSFWSTVTQTDQEMSRPWIYTEIVSDEVDGVAIRNLTHKLHRYSDGTELFFDLSEASIESTNLLDQDNFAESAAYEIYLQLVADLDLLIAQSSS